MRSMWETRDGPLADGNWNMSLGTTVVGNRDQAEKRSSVLTIHTDMKSLASLLSFELEGQWPGACCDPLQLNMHLAVPSC